MRGKAPTFKDPEPPSRITPAYAGKSCPAVYGNRLAQDHPRVCGEKCRNPIIAQAEGGSPPRMRGKVPCVLFFGVGIGITPAYAGKRNPRSGHRSGVWDHPRVCGEKVAHPLYHTRKGGSPPRMRGKAEPEAAPRPALRITPAYAGKRQMVLVALDRSRDHPRVCGEKSLGGATRWGFVGSPPRMRGKVTKQKLADYFGGITPAYAGKRLKRSHSIGHFSCILCLFHSVLHRASASGGSRAGPCAPPCLPAQNAVPV